MRILFLIFFLLPLIALADSPATENAGEQPAAQKKEAETSPEEPKTATEAQTAPEAKAEEPVVALPPDPLKIEAHKQNILIFVWGDNNFIPTLSARWEQVVQGLGPGAVAAAKGISEKVKALEQLKQLKDQSDFSGLKKILQKKRGYALKNVSAEKVQDLSTEYFAELKKITSQEIRTLLDENEGPLNGLLEAIAGKLEMPPETLVRGMRTALDDKGLPAEGRALLDQVREVLKNVNTEDIEDSEGRKRLARHQDIIEKSIRERYRLGEQFDNRQSESVLQMVRAVFPAKSQARTIASQSAAVMGEFDTLDDKLKETYSGALARAVESMDSERVIALAEFMTKANREELVNLGKALLQMDGFWEMARQKAGQGASVREIETQLVEAVERARPDLAKVFSKNYEEIVKNRCPR